MTKEFIRLLTVEDNAGHAELIRRAFESTGTPFEMVLAESLAAARRALQETVPDVMLVDLLLPDGRGVELLPGERKVSYPIIIMTSHGDEQVAVEALKAGAFDYVVKTERSLVELPKIVGRALREWDLIRQREQAEAQRANLEEQLRQAKKLETIGTLAGGIAHDFNNILSPILGYAEMALQDVDPQSRVHSDLCHIIRAGKRARALVQHILIFSRQNEPERKRVEMQPLLGEALDLLKASLPRTIEIETRIDPDCGPVLADPTQLVQLVMNLGTNAYHAMRETGGRLEIVLEPVTGEDGAALICLRVRDNGHGMDAATQERIFDPFFTRKGVREGTGLGLSVVHGIVKSHGGEIEIDSALGRGTEVRVYLPRVEGEILPEASDVILRPGSERVLLIDDEEEVMQLCREILERLGYDVRAFVSPVRALEEWSVQPEEFDVVVTDQTMPGMSGLELAEKLRRVRDDVPIVLTTGFSEEVTHEELVRVGIGALLLKPIVAHDFSQAIRSVLDLPQRKAKTFGARASTRRMDRKEE